MASERDRSAFVTSAIDRLQSALAELREPPYPALLSELAQLLAARLGEGSKAMFCGNGGSAADAQHLAAELVGRQNYDRAPAAGLALTVDSSALTALANDFGYETVFERQVQALGRPGDVLVGISTSGRSVSVIRAIEAARQAGIATIAFTGRQPRDMAGADHVLAVPADDTPKIQELQITCGHIIFALVEQTLFPRQGD